MDNTIYNDKKNIYKLNMPDQECYKCKSVIDTSLIKCLHNHHICAECYLKEKDNIRIAEDDIPFCKDRDCQEKIYNFDQI